VRLVRRPDGRGGRLSPGPRELALLTSQIMGAGGGGRGGGGRTSLAAAPASRVGRGGPLARRPPADAAAAAAASATPSDWRRLYALFAEFSDVLNPVHVSALLTALPRAIRAEADAAAADSAAAAAAAAAPRSPPLPAPPPPPPPPLLAAFGSELVELAGQLLPSGGAGARELVACACGCARLWGRSSPLLLAPSQAAATAGGGGGQQAPPSGARRLAQLVAARARPAFLSDAELAALGWAVAELSSSACPPPRAFVRAYAEAARGRLAEMRPGELCQVGRALALMAASAVAEGGGGKGRFLEEKEEEEEEEEEDGGAAAAAASSAVVMVSASWVEAFARACEARAPSMDARDVAAAAWAAAALARRVEADGGGGGARTVAAAAAASSSPLPALAGALLQRAAEVAATLEDRHVATLLWACGAFATPAPAPSAASSFPPFSAPAALPRAWARFEARVLDARWPGLLLLRPPASHATLRHAAVALVASARLGLAAREEHEARGGGGGGGGSSSSSSPFRAATLAAATAGLASAAAYLAPPPAAADAQTLSPSPPSEGAKPAPSLVRDVSSVLWALQRDHAARPAAAAPAAAVGGNKGGRRRENQQQPPLPAAEAAAARAAGAALAEALALRRRWRARARRRAAGGGAASKRFFGPDGLPRAPPLALRPADLSVALWSMARLGLLSPAPPAAASSSSSSSSSPQGQPQQEEGGPPLRPAPPPQRPVPMLRDAVAEASELLPLFGARETAGLLLALARARYRGPVSPSSSGGGGGGGAGGGGSGSEPWGERALVHFASLLPPTAAERDRVVGGGGGGGNHAPCSSSSPSSKRAFLHPRPAPRDLAGAIYGAGAALRRGQLATSGPALPLLPPPAWALRRLAASSLAALPRCGAAELVMLLRGFAGLRWHPGPAWAAAHARRCAEVATLRAGGAGGFSARETAALQRAARRLHAVRPDAWASSSSSGSDGEED
jgi:hypothetical protein